MNEKLESPLFGQRPPPSWHWFAAWIVAGIAFGLGFGISNSLVTAFAGIWR